MAEISTFMAARNRLLKGENATIAGALLAKPDIDYIVSLVDGVYGRKKASNTVLDALELELADRIDAGDDLPISNTDGMRAAEWVGKGNPTNWPSPIPRDFGLYLAVALVRAEKQTTVRAALQWLLANKTFE